MKCIHSSSWRSLSLPQTMHKPLEASSDEEAGRFSGLIEGNYFINYMKRVITTSLEYNKELIVLAKNLRRNMTKAERKLWYEFLKNYQVKFQRQKTIENYIVDFYCAKAKIVIELDGGGHYTPEQIECDQERTKVLEEYKLKVLRFTNTDVLQRFYSVCTVIDNEVKNILKISPSVTA